MWINGIAFSFCRKPQNQIKNTTLHIILSKTIIPYFATKDEYLVRDFHLLAQPFDNVSVRIDWCLLE